MILGVRSKDFDGFEVFMTTKEREAEREPNNTRKRNDGECGNAMQRSRWWCGKAAAAVLVSMGVRETTRERD
jgi:hypothetical protein